MQSLSETARVTISPKLGKYQKPIRTQILEWLQENPDACKNTTFRELSKVIFIPNSGITQKQAENALVALSHENIIGFRKGTSPRGKNIYINYLHPKIPNWLLNKAPDPDVEKTKEVIENAKIKEKARKIEIREVKEVKEANSQKQLTEQKPQTTSVSVPIPAESLSNGFSLTLNINFTITK